MSELRVWAPDAESVRVGMARGRVPMEKAGDGWWRLAEGPAHGEDYAFFLDGEGPFPDPRSPRQPDGVHGASRMHDPSLFPWTDGGWRPPPLASGVVYEMHVGTFTPEGSFDAAIARLDELVDLGITHVELMPVAAFPGARGWGYDGVALFAPHEPSGGPDGLMRLVDACHARGLAVLLDVVMNHLGPDGNYLGRFGPYFSGKYATPWGDAVNFDERGSDGVRRFFVDLAVSWLRDYRLDGLRLDAVHAILDQSAIPFLEQLAREVGELSAATGRDLVLIAESDLNDPRLIRAPEAGGFGLDAQWSDDFHHALHSLLTGERTGYYADFGRVADVAAALARGFVYGGRPSAFRGRTHGRPVADLPPTRLFGYAQTHDQVGNRAKGDRLAATVDEGGLMIAAALVLTGPFVPMLFMGEEWGATTPFYYFTDHVDPELGEAVRQGRRREFAAFGWDPDEIPDPQAEETFLASKLDRRERDGESHARLLGWHRDLIRLRRTTPALTDGRWPEVRHDEAAGWLAMRRGPILTVVNFSDEERTVPLPIDAVPRALLLSDPDTALAHAQATLPPLTVAILKHL